MPNITFPFTMTRIQDALDFGLILEYEKCILYTSMYSTLIQFRPSQSCWVLFCPQKLWCSVQFLFLSEVCIHLCQHVYHKTYYSDHLFLATIHFCCSVRWTIMFWPQNQQHLLDEPHLLDEVIITIWIKKQTLEDSDWWTVCAFMSLWVCQRCITNS